MVHTLLVVTVLRQTRNRLWSTPPLSPLDSVLQSPSTLSPFLGLPYSPLASTLESEQLTIDNFGSVTVCVWVTRNGKGT